MHLEAFKLICQGTPIFLRTSVSKSQRVHVWEAAAIKAAELPKAFESENFF